MTYFEDCLLLTKGALGELSYCQTLLHFAFAFDVCVRVRLWDKLGASLDGMHHVNHVSSCKKISLKRKNRTGKVDRANPTQLWNQTTFLSVVHTLESKALHHHLGSLLYSTQYQLDILYRIVLALSTNIHRRTREKWGYADPFDSRRRCNQILIMTFKLMF